MVMVYSQPDKSNAALFEPPGQFPIRRVPKMKPIQSQVSPSNNPPAARPRLDSFQAGLARRLAGFTLILVALQSSLFAATYYVAKTGNDSNPGTQLAPWLTVQKAADTMVAGDTVNVAAGTYAERVRETTSGTSGAHITYQGASAATVTIGAFSISGAYIDIKNVNLDGTGAYINDGAFSFDATANHCSVSDSSVTGAQDLTATWGGIICRSNNCTFSNVTITNPHYHSMCLGGTGHLVSGCTITDHNGWDIIRMVASNTTIRGCTITASHPEGQANHSDIIQSFNDGGDQVSQNVFFENNVILSGDGYQVGNVTDDQQNGAISGWTFRNNVFIDVTNCFNLFAPNFSFYNNTFIRVGTTSSWVIIWGSTVHGHSNNLTIENNIFYQCGDPTRANCGWYGGDAVTGLVADYNLVIGTGAGMTKTGLQTGGLETHGINGRDPLFVNPALNNFHLQSSSPCLGAGVPLNGVFTTDSVGVTRGAVWDMGAFQSTNSPIAIVAPTNVHIAVTIP